MKYMLLFYANESAAPQEPEQLQAIGAAWGVFLKETNTAGVMVSTGGILPGGNATTVRVRNDKTLITDGPFAETHEQLGGYAVLECADLDEAISWAEKMPPVKYGSVEIRPLWSEG